VDAALVYRTDVIAAGNGVLGIEVPEALTTPTYYYAVDLTGAPNPDAARAFVDFLQSPAATEVLVDAGFTTG